jgi:phosphate transport system ATP-binding protein
MRTSGEQDSRDFAIRGRGLNLWYGDFQALHDVDLDVKPRLITSLIGPSGCGKTTLLRCFNRINERYGNVTTRGEITILGRNIYDPDVSLAQLRRTIGMVFQRPNPLPISIYKNVLFGIHTHSERRLSRSQQNDMVEQALRDVELWDDVKDITKRKATFLTLEQQQKLCIARLLPLKPQIMLMDEPCSALDAEGTRRVEELLKTLGERFTIVIVTHNMAQARRISDECMFMLNGELVEHDVTSTLFVNPKDKRTEQYIEGRYG